jgi:hypothetical protein
MTVCCLPCHEIDLEFNWLIAGLSEVSAGHVVSNDRLGNLS